jgi:diaminobutyrate-2-oxoglutarate transaminase
MAEDDKMDIFEELESDVHVYARSFPVTFNRAKNEFLYDESGKEYIDFLAGAGSLNYGHNNDALKKALLTYIENDGITQGLDMHTQAKAAFMDAFNDLILKPRNLDYRMQFTGPTGANAVEAAMKLARKVKGREPIVTFTNGFHGVTLGAVAATGNQHHRGGAGVTLNNIQRMPYCGYHGQDVDTIKQMDKLLSDPSSGVDHPAAVLVEVVQGEGGLNVAKEDWLRNLAALCEKHDMLLIVDDIQAGCGRTGTFFSFEHAGITPDIVTMSKSLSGYGLPMAVVLLKPELDVWAPGEHNGTFRGNSHAFVTATAALETYWKDSEFAESVQHKAQLLRKSLKAISDKFGATQARLKGRGLMQGLECRSGEIASEISRLAFEKGLVIETAGNRGQVVKCLVPLTISEESLLKGLKIVAESFDEVMPEKISQVS